VSLQEPEEDVLLSLSDDEEQAFAFGSGPKRADRTCNSVEDAALSQPSIKSNIGLQVKSARIGAEQQQKYSFAGLAECLIYCQDILLFGIALGSFYFWHSVRTSQVEQGKKSAKQDDSQNGGTIAARNKSRSSLNVAALVKAMYSENKDELKKMLDERSVNACDDLCCCTALHIAAHYKCMEVAEALLDRGADADVKDVWDETPLHFAARVGHIEMCALLLKSGAAINAVNAQDRTPLLVAAEAGMVEACEFLLDHAGHAGGINEEDLPPLLNRLLFSRITSGHCCVKSITS
jgi:hypothetical protein